MAFRTVDNCVIEVADPAVLAEIAQQFDARLVEQIARRWLGWVPDPLTAAERAAGYPWRLSIYQAEFSDNVIFHRTQVLNHVYEEFLRDHLHLGRPDMLKVVFGRRIQRNTPGTFKTRLLRQGVVSCLKVFSKKSFLKQYNKGGRVLRTEVCVNDPRDFRIGRSLVHLGYLGTVAYHAIGRFKAFSHTDLRAMLVDRFGAEASEVTPAWLSSQLTKLRGKGLLRKVLRRNCYTLTDRGYRVALYFTKLHQRLLSPTLDSLDPTLRSALIASPHRFDRALDDLNGAFDHLAELSGLSLAA